MSAPLPNLLIAGVPKAGTSALFKYLSQHPDICPSNVKEIGYFNPLRAGSELPDPVSYEQYFTHCKGERYLLEATPSYCYGGRPMIEAIERVLGRPRVIIILRDPIERLWSAYTFQRTKGHLGGSASFEAYVSACETKRREGTKQGPYHGGLSISFYGEYLEDWFELLGDRLKIVFSDSLGADSKAVVADLCDWLSIDERVADSFDYRSHNKTAHARSLALSKSARALKGVSEQLLGRAPALKQGLRRLYVRVNTGELQERLEPEMRERLTKAFWASNLAVARLLRESGYRNLPSWLPPEGTNHAGPRPQSSTSKA